MALNRKKLFGKGFAEVEKEKERQEKERSDRSLFKFILKEDGDEADVIFLTPEPITYYEHTVKAYKNGKEYFENKTCTGDDDCPLCAEGQKLSFKGAFLILDKRPYTYEKDGKKVTKEAQIRIFSQGTKVLSQLGRISEKYGALNKRDLTIVRIGKGTQTSYTIERGDKHDFDIETDLQEYMPEFLAEKFDGTVDSLYAILEDTIMSNMPHTGSEDEEQPKKGKSKVEIDEEISTGDEEEEETKPSSKVSKLFKKKK